MAWGTRLAGAATALGMAVFLVALLQEPIARPVAWAGLALAAVGGAATAACLTLLRRRRSAARRQELKQLRSQLERQRVALAELQQERGRRPVRSDRELAQLARLAEQASDAQSRARRAVNRLDELAADRVERASLALEHRWNWAPGAPVPQPEAPHDRAALASDLIAAGRAEWARTLVSDETVRALLTTSDLIEADRRLDALGYYDTAVLLARSVADRRGTPKALARLNRSIYRHAVHSWQPAIGADVSHGDCFDPEGPIVHVVGKALPDTQAGYTLRTQYLTRAQLRAGLRPIVIAQAGGEKRDVPEIERTSVDGVPVVRLAGPRRGALPWPEWMELNIEGLCREIRQARPRVLHAHSDFVNGLIAAAAGERTGVPVVYETRGFWEETWLSAALDRHAGDDLDALFAHMGVPEAYAGRQTQERHARARADRVITLAGVMAEHIVAIDGADADPPVLLPNAVDGDQFTPADGSARRAALGYAATDHVIGYITSVTEYEGIDVLIRAFARLDRSDPAAPRPRLLIVGDGPAAERLQALTAELGVDDVTFTGKVPHEDVAAYYAAIDTFVVPRRPTPVTELVTPLKPFEAMAMAKRLVVSDVRALREIVEESGCGRSFTAGDPEALARVLTDELGVAPGARTDLRARQWVLEHRTWGRNAEIAAGLYGELADARSGVAPRS